jgi:hypothetical protein
LVWLDLFFANCNEMEELARWKRLWFWRDLELQDVKREYYRH